MAVQQNSQTSADLNGLRGQDVQLAWDSAHEYRVSDERGHDQPAAAAPGSEEEEDAGA
jgi:catalase (peroxidase I)